MFSRHCTLRIGPPILGWTIVTPQERYGSSSHMLQAPLESGTFQDSTASVHTLSWSATPQILVISRISWQSTLKLWREQGCFLSYFYCSILPELWSFLFCHHFIDHDNFSEVSYSVVVSCKRTAIFLVYRSPVNKRVLLSLFQIEKSFNQNIQASPGSK